MANLEVQLTGWKAVAVLAVLVGAFGMRLLTFNDGRDDPALLEKLRSELMTEYFPADVAQLRAAMDSGNDVAITGAAKAATTFKVTIEEVRTSAPLLSIASKEDVVVKVTYSVGDAYGSRGQGTKYYLFEHGTIGDVWRLRHETGVVHYYLNFM